MTNEELKDRIQNDFQYHPPTPHQVKVYEELRDNARALAYFYADVCPMSRELMLAITHLETSVMFANAAIARNK